MEKIYNQWTVVISHEYTQTIWCIFWISKILHLSYLINFYSLSRLEPVTFRFWDSCHTNVPMCLPSVQVLNTSLAFKWHRIDLNPFRRCVPWKNHFFSRSQPAFGCHQHLKQLSKLLVSKGWALRQSNATEVQHLLAYRSILCQLFEQDWPTLLWGWFNNIVIFNKYLVSYCTIAYILFLLVQRYKTQILPKYKIVLQ